MADVTPEIPDKAKEAKEKATAATSVPQLRIAVEELCEAVQEQAALIAKLQKKVGR